MKRKVSICTLCGHSTQGAAGYLEQKLREYDLNLSSADYGDIAEFTDAVSNSNANGGITVAAVPVSSFLNAKLRVLRLFSSKIIRNNAIINAMGENAPENPKEKDLYAAVPEKSEVFVCSGGLYSAFATQTEQGITVFIPLDGRIIDETFALGLGGMLEKAFPKEKRTPKFSLNQVKDSVQKVIDNKKTVAISPCGSAKALLSVINAVPDSNDVFVPDSNEKDAAEGESLEAYIAESARLSKEKSQTDLGVSISSVCADENGDEYVLVCVANSERAKVEKIFAIPGEDKKSLIAAAVVNLCQMVGELSGGPLINPATAPIKQEKNKKTPLIISIAAVAVAVVVCFILAIVSGTKNAQSSIANAGMANKDNAVNVYDKVTEYEYAGGVGLDDFELEDTNYPIETTANVFTLPDSKTTTQKPEITQIITTLAQILTTKPTTTRATTTKPTTTKATTVTTTTTKASTTAATTERQSTTVPTTAGTTAGTTLATPASGKFVFKVYGYGHGVGMSQSGAIHMANNGSSYDDILTHYFPGTTVKTDSATPATVKYGGKDIPIVEYICKTVKKEMGYSNAPVEALKAQVVVIYTYAKYYNFDVAASKHAYDSGFEYQGTKIHSACLSALGMSSDEDTPNAVYVDYNGSAAFTCYFSRAAGRTTSSQAVWGAEYPYLKGGVSSPEDSQAHTYEISADEMKKLINAYDSEIVLSDNPAEWLKVVSHDGCINDGCGYVSAIRVGNKEMRGNRFRGSLMKYKIKSHCFTVEYVK